MAVNFFGSRSAAPDSSRPGETRAEARKRLQPWVEKYRPCKITEVAHQSAVVNTLSKSLETGDLPHLMFYGPAGTGKTSTILALARQMFGESHFRNRVLELNASDDRGISVVRDKIKAYAMSAVASGQVNDEGRPCPQFKIIILDEADNMTHDAQAALRRIMEVYASVTRFCIICNYVTKMIEPLSSRCAKFRFAPISDETQLARLEHVISKENITVTDDAKAALLNTARGDLRRSITVLQGAHQLMKGEAIDGAAVVEVSGEVPETAALEILEQLRKGNFNSTRPVVQRIVCEGYNVMALLQRLQQAIICADDLLDVQKASLGNVFAEVDYRLAEGSDEQLQLLWLGAQINRVFTETPPRPVPAR
mmetsp:Transcript_31614/g.69256  ORF Transcript_31614/g.69256 Transcript_31614/m.69256 type:complete len:366 (+) Transcript_31614:19-1116(+)